MWTTRVMGLLAFGLAVTTVAAGEHWPQWRGPDLNGTSDSTGLPAEWSESQNVVWKVPLPAWAGATPIIWGNHVFVTSPSAEGDAAPSVRRAPPGPGGRTRPGGADLLLMCFDKRDGALRWQRKLGSGNTLYGKQNMASPSPVTDGKHVWALTGTGVLTAFDFAGKELWRHDLQKLYGEFGLLWGYASSPLLYEDMVVVEVLHGATTDDPSYIVAFDGNTGRTVWRTERITDATRECPDAYTTPTILNYQGQTQLVISGADYVTGHDPRTGTELWRSAGLNPERRGNYRVCGSPTAVGGYVYATSRRKPVIAIRAGGAGDVTASHLAWRYDGDGGPDVPTPACDGKHLYLVDDRGIVTCLDAKSGRTVWGPARTARGTVSASPLLADGKLYVTNERAVTTVLAAGSDFEILSTNTLDGGYTIASIAVSGSHLFVRTASRLYCIGAVAP